MTDDMDHAARLARENERLRAKVEALEIDSAEQAGALTPNEADEFRRIAHVPDMEAKIERLRAKVEAADAVASALEAIGALPEGMCVCPGSRDARRPEHMHVGECREARAALAAYREAGHE